MGWPARVASVQDSAAFIADGEAFGIFERDGGGLAGVAELSRGKEPAVARIAGWIATARRGRGLGVAAGRDLLRRAFGLLDVERVWARIDPANRAARKVIQRLGFRYEGRLRRAKKRNGRWIDQECWGLLKKEWKRDSR